MKIALAVLCLAVVMLGWTVLSMNASLRQQAEEIHTLRLAQTERSQQEALAQQTECAAAASRFLVTRGWKADPGSDYKNHFSVKLNKCFVLVSEYAINSDFRTLDLYDAVEGRRYAAYIGHDTCDAAMTGKPRKCAMDSGSIWYDGDDTRSPADFSVGFRGLLNGGGSGDENTQRVFLDRIKAAFMTQ